MAKFYDLESGPHPRPRGPYRICVRCVMDSSDPDIAFDDDGVCNHCHRYDGLVRTRILSPEDAQQKLDALIETIRYEGAGKPYDCVIGVSGGVDSTFVAKVVKERGLRPLAVHLDNGWDSEIAISNISRALSKLSLDLYTHVIDWEEFKDLQRSFLFASTPDAEIPTDHAIFALLYQQATAIDVRFVITGLNVRTETHLPQAWSRGHWDWGYIRTVHRRFGKRKIKTLPHFNFYEFATTKRYSHVAIDLLDMIDYSKKKALSVLEQELGWRDYGGKHFESVYTRWFQGCYLPHKFGFDKRRSHLSSRICSGEITRDEGLAELQRPPYFPEQQEADCEYVAKKLGFSAAEFAAIMKAPAKKFSDYASYESFLKTRSYRLGLRGWQLVKWALRLRPAGNDAH